MVSPKIYLIGLSSMLFALNAQADFLPENNLYLQDYLEADGGITESDFNDVMDQAQAVYGPIIKAQGGQLNFTRNWKDSTVNASANRLFNIWYVNMYGGLARRPEITKDGFTMVVCHELGHHLSGFPYVSSWAADEGNSDYFAALSCARNLWQNDSEGNAEAAADIPEFPKALCDEEYYGEGQARVDLCYREMLASYSVSNLLGSLEGVNVDYNTPDKSKVSTTYHGHPHGQCRMDTYMAGTLCQAKFDANVIPKDEKQTAANSCHGYSGFTKNLRPTCWFKPGL